MPKKDIHPKYYPDAKVICACGNTFTIGSTKPELRVEVCYKCHPFYIGEKGRLIDTEGVIKKFERKRKEAQLKQEIARKKKEREEAKEKERETRPKSLKELLKGA